MDTPTEDDPFDWTVDQVVSYLCHSSPSSWSKSSAPTAKPDPVAFGKALEENDVNGEILLTEVTKATLQQELWVKSLGQRTGIFNAVQQLRQRSVKYQQLAASEHQTSWASHLPPGSASPVGSSFGYYGLGSCPPPLAQNTTSIRPPNLASTTVTPSPLRPVDQPLQLDSSPDVSRPDNAGGSLPEPRLKQTEHGGSTTLKRPSVDTAQISMEPKDSANQSHVTQGEHYVIDDRGRKRRRLNLGPPVSTNVIRESYIGRDKVSTTDVFYKTSLQDHDEDDFVLTKSDVPTGKRLFVNKLMKHYFQQQPYYLGMKDRKQILGVVPYPRQFLRSGDTHYFTLFTPQGKKIHVSREEVDNWPDLHGASSFGSSMLPERPPNRNDQYDMFLWKYAHIAEREDSLPPLGESGSEGGYDSDTWNEMEEEKLTKKRAGELQGKTAGEKYLSLSEINTTIDDCLETFSKDWDSKKLPIEDRKAWRLWTLSRKQRNKKQQLVDAKNFVDRLRKRLKKLRERILDEPWTKVSELQNQCQCMEPSISDLKKQEWRISVLELNHSPLKPAKETAPRSRVKKSIEFHQEDEESLDSTSEGEFDANMDDFILPDDGLRLEDDMDVAPPLEDDENQQKTLPPPPTDSDSEEDIVIPMSAKRRPRLRNSKSDTAYSPPVAGPSSTGTPTNKPHTPHKTRSSNKKQLAKEDIEVVDLTQVDESPVISRTSDTRRDSGDIHTPPLNPTTPPGTSPDLHTKRERAHSSHSRDFLDEENQDHTSTSPMDQAAQIPKLPDFGDLEGINKLSWGLLEERLDRRRLLTKAIVNLPGPDRENLRDNLNRSPLTWFQRKAKVGMKCMLSHKSSVPHLTPPESKAVMRVAALFISWVMCKALSKFEGFSKNYVTRAQKEDAEFVPFFERLSSGIDEYYAYYNTPNFQEIEDDLGSDQDVTKSTPHKKRKKEVKQSQEAKHTQRSGQQRVAHQAKLAKKLESMGHSNDDPERKVVGFGSPVIYLDSHIGRRVKPHQLSGIQFMWRELMTDEKGTGCLLAHTMGLGKTMQVISLLVTIAKAGASTKPEIRDQVPERLRKTQALILCPSSLIENWHDEFLMWTPPDPSTQQKIGSIRKITSSQAISGAQRFADIAAWAQEGGVLIMSYDLFRNHVHNNPTKNKPAQLTEELHERVKKQLLESPSIIVADEAHKMKNKDSGIAVATGLFKSRSRIALTGSPLANNLIEYYSMINWVSPGYLGDLVQFKANYVEPIEDGLYADSSNYERRRSLKKLQVLKEDVSPKVNRADISVIEKDLPAKVEFVITVPLTEIQEKCYNMYVSSLLGNQDKPIGNARLWDWLSILSLCCNHPACFRDKLLEREEIDNRQKEKSKPPSPEISDLEGVQADVSAANFPQTATSELLRLLDGVAGPLESLEFSYRAMLVTQIIEESIKVGEKVLLFSQTIATLDYMEKVLKKNGCNYSRLDGTTPMGHRQSATKEFNSSSSNIHVYLISTRAGGLGLNIPGANRVVIFDFSFNPTHEEQAVGRAYRLGQKKPVFVYRFISGGTFEDIIYNKAVFKTQLSYRVVDKKNPIRWASKSPKDYLFHVNPTKQMDLSGFKGKDSRVLDKILAQPDNHIKAIGLTETFHMEDNDKLTEEEEKEAQEELEDERLKRNDPISWERKMAERRAREMPQYQFPNLNVPVQMGYRPSGNPNYPAMPVSRNPAPPPVFSQAPRIPPGPDPFVNHQRRVGPPPLAPDMSLHGGPMNARDSPQETLAATASESLTKRNGSVAGSLLSASKGPDAPSNVDEEGTGTPENNINHKESENKPSSGGPDSSKDNEKSQPFTSQ